MFLTALACGNRVSGIAALDVTGALAQDLYHLTLAVKPGFMFKNQKMNRSPPNIRIAALESSPTICPVQAIKAWVQRMKWKDGSLFVNTKSRKPLKSCTVSKLICDLIEEADPGRLPKAHDVWKKSASLAWTRGLPPHEIVQRVFWTSSNTFIERYLHHQEPTRGISLNKGVDFSLFWLYFY